ncbi:hypothetical protein A2U01_0103912, partial [Trifolium medium]|nr:hypothetical protein [Trifolium medium]
TSSTVHIGVEHDSTSSTFHIGVEHDSTSSIVHIGVEHDSTSSTYCKGRYRNDGHLLPIKAPQPFSDNH